MTSSVDDYHNQKNLQNFKQPEKAAFYFVVRGGMRIDILMVLQKYKTMRKEKMLC